MNYPEPEPVCCNSSEIGINRGKKRVCFAPSPQIVCEGGGNMSQSERNHSWWQHDEYETSKASARTKSRKMRRTGPDLCLSAAYDRACLFVASELEMEEIHGIQPHEVCTWLVSYRLHLLYHTEVAHWLSYFIVRYLRDYRASFHSVIHQMTCEVLSA